MMMPSWILLLPTLLLVTLAAENEVAVVTCDTTKGQFEMTLYREWSPNGYDRAVTLFQEGFYDGSHFFRVVPEFLCQFGISYTNDEDLKAFSNMSIEDDPPVDGFVFQPGTISFAGSGPNSRTSHLFISFITSKQFGTNPWETPLGKVTKGMGQVVDKFYQGYGDMPPWGKGPEQQPIYNGPQYIENSFPLLDRFLQCSVKIISGDERDSHSESEEEGDDTPEEEF